MAARRVVWVDFGAVTQRIVVWMAARRVVWVDFGAVTRRIVLWMAARRVVAGINSALIPSGPARLRGLREHMYGLPKLEVQP